MSPELKKTDAFEPNIVAFLCNWCAYRSADLAGTSRFQYPPNIKAIRLMCTGSIDTVYILKALLNGADGVLIAGCHLENCHYQDGNYKAKHRIEILMSILGQIGIDKDRVWLRWIDASEGALYRDTVQQMVAEIKKIGPNPLRNTWEVWQNTVGEWKPEALKSLTGAQR